MKKAIKTKALFFDIDGTLVSFQTHHIPQSCVDALKEAKARGVKVFISTGRPPYIITNLSQIATLIDGYVSTNGAYNFVGKTTVSCHSLDIHDVDTILTDAREQDYPVLVVSESHVVAYNKHVDMIERIFHQGLGVDNLNYSLTIDDIGQEHILQLTPFITPEQEIRLKPLLKRCTFGRWHPEFVDITAGGIDKALGLREMAAFEHLNISETMAFGDGGNDIPILKAAGLGVAMGNALATVKAEADYTTTDIDADGVRNALLHFGII